MGTVIVLLHGLSHAGGGLLQLPPAMADFISSLFLAVRRAHVLSVSMVAFGLGAK